MVLAILPERNVRWGDRQGPQIGEVGRQRPRTATSEAVRLLRQKELTKVSTAPTGSGAIQKSVDKVSPNGDFDPQRKLRCARSSRAHVQILALSGG
jgi:hypothetical protein